MKKIIILTGFNVSLITLTVLSMNVCLKILTNVEQIINVHKRDFSPTITNVTNIYYNYAVELTYSSLPYTTQFLCQSDASLRRNSVVRFRESFVRYSHELVS